MFLTILWTLWHFLNLLLWFFYEFSFLYLVCSSHEINYFMHMQETSLSLIILLSIWYMMGEKYLSSPSQLSPYFQALSRKLVPMDIAPREWWTLEWTSFQFFISYLGSAWSPMTPGEFEWTDNLWWVLYVWWSMVSLYWSGYIWKIFWVKHIRILLYMFIIISLLWHHHHPFPTPNKLFMTTKIYFF